MRRWQRLGCVDNDVGQLLFELGFISRRKSRVERCEHVALMDDIARFDPDFADNRLVVGLDEDAACHRHDPPGSSDHSIELDHGHERQRHDDDRRNRMKDAALVTRTGVQNDCGGRRLECARQFVSPHIFKNAAVRQS